MENNNHNNTNCIDDNNDDSISQTVVSLFVYTGQQRKDDIPQNVTHLSILRPSADVIDKKIPNGTFQHCSELKEVEFVRNDANDDYAGSKTIIGKHAFSSCSQLKSVLCRSDSISTLKIESFAFEDCKSLVEMDLRSVVNIQDIGTGVFQGCTSLRNIHLPTEGGLVSISDRLFAHCYSLEEITIPSTVVVIGQSAFEECSGLRKVIILQRHDDDDEMTSSSCRLEIIGNQAFRGCSALMDFLFPPTLVTIGPAAFMGASSLKNLVLPKGLQWLGISAFRGCIHLRYVSIPGTLEKIEKGSFYDCHFLAEVDFHEGLKTIGELAFSCTSLRAISFPRSLCLIENCAFDSCISLFGVEIPMHTDLHIMANSSDGRQCFAGCSSLINVCIPTNMSHSADHAFSQSRSLLFKVEDGKNDDDPYDDSSLVFRPEILRCRFVHLPVHEVCYYASTMTTDDLSLALESSSTGGNYAQYSSTPRIADVFGMTPFHIIATSVKLDGAMLALLLDRMPIEDSICIKDKNDRTMMDYLLGHGSKRAVPLIKMVLQKAIQHEVAGLDTNHQWMPHLSRSIQDIPCCDSNFAVKKHVDSVMGRLTRYLGMQSTSIVELAIWKLAIQDQLPLDEQEDQAARRDCRTRCGSEIVLGNAMRFLRDRQDEVPVFVQSLCASLYADAILTSTAPVADDDDD